MTQLGDSDYYKEQIDNELAFAKTKNDMKKNEYKNEAWEILEGKSDYLYLVTKSSTEEQRRKFDIGDIFLNMGTCLLCKQTLRSVNRHDFVTCKCGNLSIDGGSWYQKSGTKEAGTSVLYSELFYDVKGAPKDIHE